MKKHNCEICRFRQKYDRNPKSILGRLWRWHIGFCPGWKSFMNSVDDERRKELEAKYNINQKKTL